MSESPKNSINILIQKAEILLKRFNEQKGIINAYIKKEREWKKHKLFQANEIKKLEKIITFFPRPFTDMKPLTFNSKLNSENFDGSHYPERPLKPEILIYLFWSMT